MARAFASWDASRRARYTIKVAWTIHAHIGARAAHDERKQKPRQQKALAKGELAKSSMDK
jgi:hypothetical protein